MGSGGWRSVGTEELIPITLDQHERFQFFITCKRTNNENNATHYCEARKEKRESSTQLVTESTQDMGSDVCCRLLEPSAPASSSPAVLQRPAHQARLFCTCRLRETGHIPAASLAPHRPRRVQEPKESRRETHERLSVYM